MAATSFGVQRVLSEGMGVGIQGVTVEHSRHLPSSTEGLLVLRGWREAGSYSTQALLVLFV